MQPLELDVGITKNAQKPRRRHTTLLSDTYPQLVVPEHYYWWTRATRVYPYPSNQHQQQFSRCRCQITRPFSQALPVISLLTLHHTGPTSTHILFRRSIRRNHFASWDAPTHLLQPLSMQPNASIGHVLALLSFATLLIWRTFLCAKNGAYSR